jgi:ribosomal protein S18 acetylase RimI-like enzyme
MSKHAESVRLREADTADEFFLYELYCSTRAEELAAWGWDEVQREAFLRLQFRAQQLHYGAQFPNADHSVVLANGRTVGRVLVNRREDEIRLVDIALLPEYRNAGIGTGLIRGLCDEGSATGRPVRLSVVKTNPALRLYQRLGFTVIGHDDIRFELEWSGRESSEER